VYVFSSHGGIGSADESVIEQYDNIEWVTVVSDQEGATIDS
jgi:hypothetical protein